jgi:hypothetical protein
MEVMKMKMRYELKVTKQGTRMDDAPLFGLTVIDNGAVLDWMKKTQYDELTEYELTKYQAYFMERNEPFNEYCDRVLDALKSL